jgi:hypothetical protein
MRTVLTVDGTGEIDPAFQTEKFMVKVERNPASIPGMTFTRALELSAAQLPDWSSAGAVVERGRLLRAALRKHAGIACVLDDLARDPDGTVHPIYVKLDRGDAELITWEALCDANDAFVALDRRWPIGRITDPAATVPRNPPLFRAPVRVLAAISALGVSSQLREWRYLRDAVRDARAGGVAVTIRVMAGDDAVYDAIKQEIADGLLWAEVTSIPGSGPRLATDIRNWQPHIVHFFCHGVSESGAQRLELATASDYKDPNATRGSVAIDAAQIVALSNALENPWLVTLNCCEGAQASEELMSLAHQAVSAAFPAAVAMLEPVDAQDAHEFTRAFYGELFAELQTVSVSLAVAGSPRAPFEWARLMREVRIALNKLHGEDASNRREWALPALYVRGVDPMYFERPLPGETEKDSARFRTTASLVAGWLSSVRGSMPIEKRHEVMRDVLADIPEKYWPDVDGSFGT